MGSKLIETTLGAFQKRKQLRPKQRYLIVENELSTMQDVRGLRMFIESMILTARHKGLKIRGAIVIEKLEEESQ